MRKNKILVVGIGMVLVACGGDDSSNGGGGGKTLVSSSSAPPDATCPNGGTKLSVGTDNNGNGTLDADEVTGTQEICNSAPPTLTTVTPTGPDATCTNGGVIVKSGPDTNGDGKLEDGEVTQTQEICGGGNGTVLSITTAVGEGNANCPLGGTQTQSGPDNGAGGGVAGDGVLQPGEIASTTYACASLPGYFVGGFAPPPAVAGQQTYTIDTHGGESGGGPGPQAGGAFTITKGGTLGGHIRIFNTGVADASFTMPTYTPKFGATKLDVTTDTTLQVHADGTSAADGEYYFSGGSLYFRQNSGNNQVPVTGFHLAAGKTFTFPDTVSQISVPDDIVVEGTVVAAHSAGNAEGVVFQTQGAFIGAAGAKLVSSGAPVANAAGGVGNVIAIVANFILNQASCDSSGADGGASGVDDGGSAGPIIFQVTSSIGAGIYNTGALTANGGKGTGGGRGGNSAGVQFQASNGNLFTSGAITSNGGAGDGAGVGGSVNSTSFFAQRGSVRMGGGLHASAGDSGATCTGACGGSVGTVSVFAGGGSLTSSSDIILDAGKSTAGTGGNGGGITFLTVPTSSIIGGFLPAGDIVISGNLSTLGGDGATGGAGGAIGIQMQTSPSVAQNGQQVTLLGYTDIKTFGRDGTSAGGTGGAVSFTNNPTNGPLAATGGIVNYANIDAHGGKANVSGIGGNGGAVTMGVGNPSLNADKGQVIFNAGSINANAGDGITGGGTPGAINLRSIERVDATAAITANGGSTSGAGGAHAGTLITIIATGGITTSGDLSTNGGNAAGASQAGGTGGTIQLVGGAIVTSKSLSAKGGNSNAVAGATGGQIVILGQGTPTQNTATLSVVGGTGTPNGNPGAAIVDGIPQ